MRIWEQFPEIAQQIRKKHDQVGLHGHHDFVHAFRVGEVARKVALDQWSDKRLADLAGLAGLCHNADRLLQKWSGRRAKRKSVDTLVTRWLQGTLDDDEVRAVVDAVVKHDGLNSSGDSRILIALMDGDRVVNLDVDLFIRSGQLHRDLPAVDYQHFLNDSEATYRNPKSVLRDIAYALEWVNPHSHVCVRTRLGQKMAEGRSTVFRASLESFIKSLKASLKEEGIHPFTL